jgi:fatty acid desaturase
MSYSLNHISFDAAVSEKNISYAQYRKELLPHYEMVKKDIAKGYAILIVGLLVGWWCSTLLIYPALLCFFLLISAIVIGGSLAYLHLFIHEGAHYNLHPNRAMNDKLTNYCLGVFFGISVKKYRKIHWQHHLHLGKPADTEKTYFNELTLIFLFKALSGIYLLNVIAKRKIALRRENKKGEALFNIATARSFIVHLLFAFLLFYFAGWVVLVTWITSLLIIFPLIASLRQLLEHRDESAVGKKKFYNESRTEVTRLFSDRFLSSFIGAAGFNKHLLHHWDPLISYTRLKEVELFLLDCPAISPTLVNSQATYGQSFRSLFKLY